MNAALALTILRELVQELREEEEGLEGLTAASVATQSMPMSGRVLCEVRLESKWGLKITAGLVAPPNGSRRRLRIVALDAITKALDEASGKGGAP